MTTVRKTFTLTDRQDAWIKTQVEEGGYADSSDYIRDLISREQERSTDLETLRQALIAGEESGEPQSFDFDRFIASKVNEHGG